MNLSELNESHIGRRVTVVLGGDDLPLREIEGRLTAIQTQPGTEYTVYFIDNGRPQPILRDPGNGAPEPTVILH